MKLPGIGEKTATRLAFYTLDMPDEDVHSFSTALAEVKENFIVALFVATLQKRIRVLYAVILNVINRPLW